MLFPPLHSLIFCQFCTEQVQRDPPVANNAGINGVPTQPKQKTNNTTTATNTAQSTTNTQLKVNTNITFKVR